MSFRGETTGNAGEDLSSLQYRFVYHDSSDSYNIDQLTDIWLVEAYAGVLQNKPTDDGRTDCRVAGFATCEAGGVINPGDYVTSDTVGRCVADTGYGVIRGVYLPMRNNQSAATGDYVRLLLLPPKPGLQVAISQWDFAVDGAAVGAITLRGATIPSGAIIHTSTLDMITTGTSPTSDAGAGALAVGGVALDAAVTIAAGTDWDAGQRALDVPGQTTSTAAVVFTVSVEDWTAGKFDIHTIYSYNP